MKLTISLSVTTTADKSDYSSLIVNKTFDCEWISAQVKFKEAASFFLSVPGKPGSQNTLWTHDYSFVSNLWQWKAVNVIIDNYNVNVILRLFKWLIFALTHFLLLFCRQRKKSNWKGSCSWDWLIKISNYVTFLRITEPVFASTQFRIDL